jgi:hypothetical protein
MRLAFFLLKKRAERRGWSRPCHGKGLAEQSLFA